MLNCKDFLVIRINNWLICFILTETILLNDELADCECNLKF